MSVMRHHAEWLSLLEVSGPFLSMPVLLKVFPQGLDAHDPEISRALRSAYEEWDDNQTSKRPNPATHTQYIRFVLTEVLKLPEEVIREGQTIPQTLKTHIPEQGETLRPDLVVYDAGEIAKPRLLIQVYPYGTDLEKPLPSKHWKATPATRMMELLHGTDCRSGLITNGERWMLVDAPRGESTGFASWYASLWLEEQITLRSFRSLLSGYRFFSVPAAETLEGLLAESAINQQEVTEQLGYQVRQAVEVLVESIDRADQDFGRKLTEGIDEKVLYEAALAVMMRLVFLMCAEERKLLLLGDPIYDQHYAISTLQAQLREAADQHGEEILEHRFDAWSRLLATFRAVHAGMQHDRMMLPAYGGHLFDPDHYPFLEGRKSSTTWKTTPATPLPINNRTVLHALEALQFLQVKLAGSGPSERRRLSFRALDVEQIGYVYEGLLDHTAMRASEPILGLRGTKDQEPEIPLTELERKVSEHPDEFYSWLKEETGRTEDAVRNSLGTELEAHDINRFHAACGNNNALWDRVRPFAGLVRDDTFGYPVVILPGSVYVTEGQDRRTTGTQYTPRSFTGPVVQSTLEPLVYVGPSEGEVREKWNLRSAKDILDLKVCDMTCGSGAFLAETCRYLADRLLEAWDFAEKQNPDALHITPEGKPSSGHPAELLIPKDIGERQVYARRLIAQRSLYGVDKNRLAVEMAKLSLWLLTLERNRPFTFLDHAIKWGDSLLGLVQRQQIESFDLQTSISDQQQTLLWKRLSEILLSRAIECRRQLEEAPAMTAADVERKEELLKRAEESTSMVRVLCDLLTGIALSTATGSGLGDAFIEKRGEYWQKLMQTYRYDEDVALWRQTLEKLNPVAQNLLDDGKPDASPQRRAFHWPIEFPEVFLDRHGFDAIVGNPPYRHGSRVSTDNGASYLKWLLTVNPEAKGTIDLVVYFLRRSAVLLSSSGTVGLVTTKSISEGDNKDHGLAYLLRSSDITIVSAEKSKSWPGAASVRVAIVILKRGEWNGLRMLDGTVVENIAPDLSSSVCSEPPSELRSNRNLCFKGSELLGDGFLLDEAQAAQLIDSDPKYRDVIKPILNGQEFASDPEQRGSRWVIDFFDMSEKEARMYPAAFETVERLVRPVRAEDNRPARRERFWRFGEIARGLYERLGLCKSVIARLFTCDYWFWERIQPAGVYTNALVIVTRDGPWDFAVLSSSIHEVWALSQGSSLRYTPRYTPSRCLGTFPFPNSQLADTVGNAYHDLRRGIMRSREQGLTETYKQFHDPNNNDCDIQELRRMHAQLDSAVADAYGWSGLQLEHDFRETPRGTRFLISLESRNRILDRLTILNRERSSSELGAPEQKPTRKAKSSKPGVDALF